MMYDAWDAGLWLVFPILMCVGMAMMMLLMMGRGMIGHGMMGGHGDKHRSAPPTDPALDTLRQRFARGEISRAEFEEQQKLLRTP